MPLSDGYQTEKEVHKEALELAKATTEFFVDMGVNDRRGFVLFVTDLPTGTVQFMSDLDRVATVMILKAWIEAYEPTVSNAPNSEAGHATKDPTTINLNQPDNGNKDHQ